MKQIETQEQMFRNAQSNTSRADETFLVLVGSGMTKSDLEKCIQKRPAIWQRYEHWLPKLPLTRPGKCIGQHQPQSS